MNTEKLEDRLSAGLDRALAGSPSGIGRAEVGGEGAADDDAIAELIALGGFLRESLTPIPASEPFRSSLRDWLERAPSGLWWEALMGPARRRLPVPGRRQTIGLALGAGTAAAIVLGLVVLRHRRASALGAAG